MYQLPELPYSFDALEPYIDAETMELHYSKHHQTYLNNLNNALEGHENWQNLPIEDLLKSIDQLPENIRTQVRNNGGGYYNHSLFWKMMAPHSDLKPQGELLSKIDELYGSFGLFKEQFSKEALGRFGSGWAWLVLNGDQELEIYSTPNQDTPIVEGFTPLLGLDVWEHAYYLKYQNRRAEYIDAWWNVIDWNYVSELYTKSRQ
jgi:Fe-Mn family superoxide dismutase